MLILRNLLFSTLLLVLIGTPIRAEEVAGEGEPEILKHIPFEACWITYFDVEKMLGSKVGLALAEGLLTNEARKRLDENLGVKFEDIAEVAGFVLTSPSDSSPPTRSSPSADDVPPPAILVIIRFKQEPDRKKIVRLMSKGITGAPYLFLNDKTILVSGSPEDLAQCLKLLKKKDGWQSYNEVELRKFAQLSRLDPNLTNKEYIRLWRGRREVGKLIRAGHHFVTFGTLPSAYRPHLKEALKETPLIPFPVEEKPVIPASDSQPSTPSPNEITPIQPLPPVMLPMEDSGFPIQVRPLTPAEREALMDPKLFSFVLERRKPFLSLALAPLVEIESFQMVVDFNKELEVDLHIETDHELTANLAAQSLKTIGAMLEIYFESMEKQKSSNRSKEAKTLREALAKSRLSVEESSVVYKAKLPVGLEVIRGIVGTDANEKSDVPPQ